MIMRDNKCDNHVLSRPKITRMDNDNDNDNHVTIKQWQGIYVR
jgi:hypothetical protein